MRRPLMLAALAGLALATGAASAQTKLSWAHVYEVTEPFHTESVWAAEEIKKRTDGRYEIANLPAGAFMLVARAGGFEAAQTMGVRTGETVPDLVLGRFSAVRGAVSSAETGFRSIPPA